MSCRQFQHLLEEERDRALDRDESLALESHARDCAACASLRRAEASLRAALRAARGAGPVVVVPADFGERVRSEVRRRGGLPAVAGGGRSLRWVLAAAATFAFATILVLHGTWKSPELALASGATGPVAASAPPAATPVADRPELLWSDGRAEVVVAPRAQKAGFRPGGASQEQPVATTAQVVEWSF